jgi:hypothetical protein
METATIGVREQTLESLTVASYNHRIIDITLLPIQIIQDATCANQDFSSKLIQLAKNSSVSKQPSLTAKFLYLAAHKFIVNTAVLVT